MTGQFREEHVLLMDRLNREKIDILGEQGFPRGEFNSTGKEKGYWPDIIIKGTNITIEVDGKIHNKTRQMKHDEEKEAWLANRGYRTLRFTNFQVRHHLDDVIKVIRTEMRRVQAP